MKNVLLFLFSFSFLLAVKAQTGPGGVGNSSSNLIWVKADEIPSLIDNDDVTSWPDISGNSNNLDQPNASFQPIFKTGVINGKPVVRFNVAENRLRKTSFASPTNAVTAILVNSTTDSNDGLISYASTSSPNDFLLFDSDGLDLWIDNASTASNISINDGLFHITNTSWRSSDGSTEIWKDGSQTYTATHKTGASITSGGSIAIANEQDAIDGNYEAIQSHDGDFAEVIIYNTYLNEAQQIIVSNYLAAKYNLPITNDYFAYQATHNSNVAGIGREDASNIHSVAKSDSMLQIGNASDLNMNQEYLIFGHDEGDVSTWTTTEAPDAGVNIQRIGREWILDETGDVGTIDFIVDIINLPTLPAGHTMYALMVDNDGDFSSGAMVYELVLNAGTEYEVLAIDISDGDYVSIAAVDPTVQHTVANSVGFEPNNAVIEISLNFIPESNRTVDYTTADGTAIVAQPDYTAASALTATILAGNQTQTYTINVTNDIVVESTENFSVTLSNPSVGIDLGTNTVHTYSINDDDNSRKIYFDLATSSASEAVTPANIAVSINNVDPVNPTTVDYAVTGGTATGSGTDFTLAAGTLTIPAGATTENIVLAINNDAIFEMDETVIIELSNPTNANLDGVAPLGGTGILEHTFTITNDDSPPVIEFDLSTNSGSETVSPITIDVNLNELSTIDASATYTVTGTASGAGTDYTLADGTIIITAGNLSNSISLTINDDLVDELNETVILTLSAPVNAALGANTTYTYTILDDEIFGHLGPGGVGNATTNKLWVKPEDLSVVADATDITTWPDASGNGHDLTQPTASFKPRYYNNIINGKPVARFDRSNGRLVYNNFTEFPSTAVTTYFVNRNTDSGEGLISYAPSAALNNNYLLFNSANLNIYLQNTNTSSGLAINNNTFRITNHTWRSSDGQNRVYNNGTQIYSATSQLGASFTTGGTLAIAGEQDSENGGYAAGQAHQGDFAEICIYNTVLNTARKKIVDNYLASKYNLTIANDLFGFDTPGSFENEVAGIGRDNNTNFHDDAQGSAIVRISNPSSLDDGDYQIWGHNNADRTLDTVDVPPGIDNRLNRVWRLQETGDMGTVTVQFDLAAFTIGSSSDLILLINSDDGSFVSATEIAITNYIGTVATFENVDFEDGDYFTISSAVRANPLPIELVSFNAELNDGKVDLYWTTASEINNDFFTIEKIYLDSDWQEVEIIKGAGNSTRTLNYKTVDTNPFEGTSYYRLKQTDYDGTTVTSEPIVVHFRNSVISKLKIYPNPTEGLIFVDGLEDATIQSIKLYDINGKLIKLLPLNTSYLDVSEVRKGHYFLSISIEGHQHFETVIIR